MEITPYLISKTETRSMIEDVVKILVLLATHNLLLHLIDQESLLGEKTIRTALYLVVGLVIYYLLVKPKLIGKLFPKVDSPKVENRVAIGIESTTVTETIDE